MNWEVRDMKLRTSFFNMRVLAKNLTRFAPLWILYAVGEVLGFMTLDLGEATYRLVDDLSYIIGPVSIFHAGYALLVAVCLFGDLFDSRLCNGLHAMPMRREGWLLTNLVSGLVFALIPALVGGGFAAIVLKEYWWLAIAWQLISLLQFVFFFGVAVFSAMCAGKRLGMIAVYTMVNFFSVLIFWVADMIYEPLLPGVVFSEDWYERFSPLVTMVGNRYYDIDITWSEISTKAVFNGFVPESWYYLFICAGVGVVFTVLSWLLYSKRHLETAGDFISFRPMRMVFLIVYTIAAGVLVYAFGDFVGLYKDYGFLVVGILIGFFTGWMLLERTLKIFTKKVFVGFAAFAILFAGSLGITAWDPLQIAAYVPETEKIANVCLYQLSDTYRYYSDDINGGWYITEPEEVRKVQMLHKQMLETPMDPDTEILNMELRYRLKNGNYVYRSYDVPAESPVAEDLRVFLSDPRAVFGTEDWQQVKDNLLQIDIYFYGGDKLLEITDREQMEAFLDAALADCRAGTMAQHSYLHRYQEQVASVDVTWRVPNAEGVNVDPNGARGEHLQIFEDCVNTAAFLETLKKD